jgi:hypothetical protein
MKRILYVLLLAFFVLSFSSGANAQEITIPLPSLEISPAPTGEKTSIDYSFPYPGILPTSPLYTLKLIRDGISDFLISDSLEKANFYLLQSDKRFSASLVLLEKDEEHLAFQSLETGMDYLENSIKKTEEAKKEQKNIGDIYGKINTSLAKQNEELKKLIDEKYIENQEKLIEFYEIGKNLEKAVNSFNP